MLVWPVATGTHVAPTILCVCRLSGASVQNTASPACVGSALDDLLKFPVGRNWLQLLGSVLVPVTGGVTKQPCMFHHQALVRQRALQQICLVR